MYYPFMVKNYQLWYFQLSCSLSFLFSLSAWGLCTLQAWIFLTNTEELQNQIHHEEKEERQRGKFIYLIEKPMGLCQKAWIITTQQLLAPSKPCSLQWQCCGWQWPPFCWGILWYCFHTVLQKNPNKTLPLISTVFGFPGKFFETNILFPFYEH